MEILKEKENNPIRNVIMSHAGNSATRRCPENKGKSTQFNEE